MMPPAKIFLLLIFPGQFSPALSRPGKSRPHPPPGRAVFLHAPAAVFSFWETAIRFSTACPPWLKPWQTPKDCGRTCTCTRLRQHPSSPIGMTGVPAATWRERHGTSLFSRTKAPHLSGLRNEPWSSEKMVLSDTSRQRNAHPDADVGEKRSFRNSGPAGAKGSS